MTRNTHTIATVAALLTGLVAGCAEERAAVDRTQPYALEKSYFVGPDLLDPSDNPVFWTQGTLIDVGYGAAQDGLFTSTYAQPMSRMRWQITEDLLLGRLAYERIEGSDGKGAGRATNDGVIVVAYAIEKHFDIVRAYNSTTGEQLNIMEENTTDRPWYEREYMRVDWSKNLNTDSYDFDTLSLLGVYGGVEYEPLSYDITDPSDPNAPNFELADGYFDVTNKAFAMPGLVDLSHLGWGIDSFPACFLDADFSGGTYPAGSCSPVELTIRQSFRKVEDTDYQPEHWDGHRFQAYGAFTVDRFGYDRNYRMSDEKWHRFIARYNIWERSHFYEDPEAMTGPVECYTPDTTPFGADPHRDADGNGTEDECEAVGGGSHCDTFRQRCTLPYEQRTTRPTAWYYTNDSNLEYFDGTSGAAHEWDVALRVAARTAQYAECQATGAGDCATRFPIYFGQEDDNFDAVQLAREVDACRNGLAYAGEDCMALADRIGAERGYDPGVIAVAKMPEMIVLCHSPVEATDPEPCAGPRLPEGVTAADCAEARRLGDAATTEVCDAALNVRRGDLRYHQINVLTEPQTPSPWGIYTDSHDPLTGETVSASINVWSWVNDYWSQAMIDKIRYIKGELTTEQITEGEYVRDWVAAAEAAAGGGALPRLSQHQLASRVASFSGGDVETLLEAWNHTMEDGVEHGLYHDGHDHDVEHGLQALPGVQGQDDDDDVMSRIQFKGAGLPDDLREQVLTLRRELTGVKASLDAPSQMQAKYAARREAARGTEFEAELITPMIQQMAGVEGLPLSESVLDRASPLRGGNPTVQRRLYNFREAALAERGACILGPEEAAAPLSITGLADVLEDKFGAFNPHDSIEVQNKRAERMRRYIAQRVQHSVIVHEMGHSIGMRHNFVSSSDAWGYRPQYWQLRTKNGQVTDYCRELTDDGESCVGPRYFDPVTQEERDNLIWMFMHSSVMDYPGEATQDMMGLGVFDFAAARMFYGDIAAVHADEAYNVGKTKSTGMLEKMDSFGGILGIQYTLNGYPFHYSQLQTAYGLISDCHEIPDPTIFRPATWNRERDGEWSPLLDGLIVKVDGSYSRCAQEQVDYVPWSSLRMPSEPETGDYYYGGPSVDPQGRTRMPYGFGTDSWADLGNLSVYRHDNGADPYELFNFFVTQQEVGHIFDYYRRGRQGFSVRNATSRTLNRFNAKMRDGAKGLGLYRNIYKDFALEVGYDFDSFWPVVAEVFEENILASGLAFDHFTRMLARPEIGEHFYPEADQVLRSTLDTFATPGPTQVIVPNGATGYYEDVGIGGKLVENRLADDQGEYDSEYTINAGSYYDKLSTAMLMTESVDNFISDSRLDFVDPRYRAVSMADLFPDGYRRWLANNLTGDDLLKGPRIASSADGAPKIDSQRFPTQPIGWTTWWGDTPEACFPNKGTTLCTDFANPTSEALHADAPDHVAVLDPQVGWEQQKFLIAWTLLYLPENQLRTWLDMMGLWELGRDTDPEFGNRIEFHNPSGMVYVAKTYGKETIFGKSVQRGVAARVLEYANELLERAYETEPGPDLDGDGGPDWYTPVYDDDTGQPIVRWDSTVALFDESGNPRPGGIPGCNLTDNSECTCSANRACVELERYISVPAYLREAISAYQLGEPRERGIY